MNSLLVFTGRNPACRFPARSAALAMLSGIVAANAALAQGTPPQAGIEEIVVTAQKREQSANDVPMSITAATGDQLEQAGIEDPSDLYKITPGLSFGKNNLGIPVFTLRGIGYNDVAIATRPAVTIYLDEAPIPFAAEAMGVGLDVERVEVLKGPQGTLFGNNSTGGAINYIAVKPTTEFEAGGHYTYGRFNQNDIEGYVSGPLTSTLGARLTFEHDGMDDWQSSYTRSDDHGKKDFTNGRLSLAWTPSDALRAALTVSSWADRGDMTATQVIDVAPQVPPVADLTPVPGIKLAPHDNRAADWDPDRKFDKDNEYFQTTARFDYDISERYTLTSLTNYLTYDVNYLLDSDGVDFESVSNGQKGDSESFSQELRVAAKFDRINAILGGFYSHDTTNDDLSSLISEGTISYAFTGLGAPRWTSLVGRANQDTENYAIFTNLDYSLTDKLTLQGGARYTNTTINGHVCGADLGDGNAATVINTFLNNAFRIPSGLAPVAAPQPGECVTIDTSTFDHGSVDDDFDEDNVSWRAGLQYALSDDTLLYANVSKGYKAGGYSSFGAIFTSSYLPATQESVLAYEAGFKTGLGNQVQLNGALFHSDYDDKQVLGNVVDPILGTIARLVNVPKSSVDGAELQIVAVPFEGMTLTGGGSYIKSEIKDHYTDFNALQVLQDMDGTMLPYAPEWQGVGSARYEWQLSDNITGFVGANVSYQSESFSYLGEVDLARIKPYTLTDLQAGVEGTNGNWRVYGWGRNVFDEYYWNSAARLLDTAVRWPGMGRTWGVTVSYKFQ